MSAPGTHREVEVKIAMQSANAARDLLRRKGFQVAEPRSFEDNFVFDYPDARLRQSGSLLRLRENSDGAFLTFKGAGETGKHKSREETELQVEAAAPLAGIFERIGLAVTFRYQKYRTAYAADDDAGGIVLLDETPIGVWLELEGEPAWIDATAATLGFRPADYITASYGALYLDYCTRRNQQPAHMVFPLKGA